MARFILGNGVGGCKVKVIQNFGTPAPFAWMMGAAPVSAWTGSVESGTATSLPHVNTLPGS